MKNEPTTGVLEKLLEPISRSFNPESARALAEMEAEPAAHERVAETQREIQCALALGSFVLKPLI